MASEALLLDILADSHMGTSPGLERTRSYQMQVGMVSRGLSGLTGA